MLYNAGPLYSIAPLYAFSNLTSTQINYFPYFWFPFIAMPQSYRTERELFKPDTSYKSALFERYGRRFHPGKYDYGEPNLPGYEFKSEYDDETGGMKVYETFNGQKVFYERELTLNEYLNEVKQRYQEKKWDSISSDYDLKKAFSGGDLARLMSTATGFSIPLPPNPIFSIFGSPKISINVNGEVNVRVGWRWNTQNLGTVSQFGQTQSTPIFSQDIRVNVSGSIGDKLKLSTDWNTRRSFDMDNRFKIGFEGEDDDIIKLVEVGNVSMPSYNSLIGGGQTLFGVRADFQFGPLFLKTILSQRRGERRYVDVQGGKNLNPFTLRAYDYVRNYFFLNDEYKQVYNEYFKYATPVLPVQFDSISVKEIEVWESTTQLTNTKVREAVAHNVLPKLRRGENYPQSLIDAPITAGKVERGRFQLLDSTKWELDYNLGTLRIENLSPDRTYAVSYRLQGPSQSLDDDQRIGYLSSEREFKEVMVLQLVYVRNLQPGFKELWGRQMKNIYNIGATNVDASSAKINIWYLRPSNDSVDVLEGSNQKIVTIFGVDRTDNSGQVQPDGKYDMREPFFNAQRGEITFPSVEPFRAGLYAYFDSLGKRQVADKYVYGDVYDTTWDVAKINTARDRFIISGEVSGSSSNRIRLGAFNLAPGSVKISLDGSPLREYQDFVVDYFSGTVQLRNPRATLPNANLKIEYEQADIFQVSTKTLAGLRADYNLIDSRRVRSDLGFTFMHYNQSAVIDQVQLGQEPVANTMMGFDAKLNWDTPWLTKLLDYLPFYDTKAKSNFDFLAEWAMMFPEPNKRKSVIPSDDGESVVYIDNFEAAQRRITLGLNPSLWSHSSAPVDETIAPTAEERNLYRGSTFWYQKFIPWIRQRDVYPDKQVLIGQNNLSPLQFYLEPYIRGIYNNNPEFLDTLNPMYDESQPHYILRNGADGRLNKDRVWGGMMRLLSSFNTNFDNENIQFIEIMMNVYNHEQNTKLYLDLGQISEDVIPNGKLNTEDGITAKSPLPNGLIDIGEDVGIDGLSNEEEKTNTDPNKLIFPYPLSLEDDPARDDYFFDFKQNVSDQVEKDFVKYNNFENNSKMSEMGAFPDTEILNDNNGQQIALDNSYFRYEIDISNLNESTNPQIVGGNPSKGWYLFRIPIRKPTSKVGNPQFTNIQYVRLAAQGGVAQVWIADWALVGSQWQRINTFQSVPPSDSAMQVSFVNSFENGSSPDYYTMPPGVRSPRQINSPNPQQNIRLNEQSLRVCVSNLKFGEERMATRIFQNMDIFYYKKLKFFVHGDGSMPNVIQQGTIPDAYVYMRFGIDSNNYYEYKQPLTSNWDDIEIDLRKLTSIKQIRDNSKLNERQEFPAGNGNPNATFAIKGTPILTRISFFGFGVANPSERFPNDLTTCIWVDELRLTDAENSNDWAANVSSNLQLADLGTVTASMNTKQANFHKLEERFGDRKNDGNFTISMQGNLEKLAPKEFKQMKIPIAYTHAELLSTPKFIANTDLALEEAMAITRDNILDNGGSKAEADREANKLKDKSELLKVQDQWSLTGIKLGIPVNHWSINETLNKLNFNYTYSQEYTRTPVYENRFNWNWTLDANYTNSLPDILAFSPTKFLKDVPVIGVYGDWKLNLLPSNIGFGLNMTRGRQTEQSRFLTFASPVVRSFFADRKANFTWKLSQGGLLSPSIDYSFNTRSSLIDLEHDEFGNQRTGSQISNAMFSNGFDFGRNTTHNQMFTINFKPILPVGFLNKYLDMNGSYNVNYSWNDPLMPDPAVRDRAKNATYNGQFRYNINVSLRSFGDEIFGITPSKMFGKRKDDKTGEEVTDWGSQILLAFKSILLDYEKINITLSQTNNSTNPGVFGGTGMSNFWGRGITGRESLNNFGPSFAYQMGLTSNPHGGFNISPSSSFPFFSFDSYPGLRPPNGRYQDNYRQSTDLNIATNRPLWEGATLDLTWKTSQAFNRNQTVITDVNGVPTFTNVIAMQTIDKSYISLPTIFGLNLFGNTVEDVVKGFELRRDAIVQRTDIDTLEKNKLLNRALAQSFYEELEAFSFSGVGQLGHFLPSINWGIRWTGIEKWTIWGGYLKKVQVDHNYTSNYSEAVQITDNGRVIQNQQVTTGFSPLIGVNVSFDEAKTKGTLTGSIRWNRTQGYNLNAAAKSVVTSQTTNEIAVQANYTMNSFSIPFLGFQLKNELEFSFLGSYKFNGRGTFDVFDPTSFSGGQEQGRVLDGSTVVSVEPRVRYSLSERLTASFFVRYDGTFNVGASNPGFHTTQVGLDFRLSIAGGR